MFHLDQLIYNTFWYYTMVSESCIGFFQNIRNQCGCSKKVTDVSLEETCDSIVFKKHTNSSNSITYYTFIEKDVLYLTDEYTCCDYEFLEVTLTLTNNQSFDIKLNRDNCNFYCVGNKLNHTFFEWYLKTYYNFKCLEPDTYNVSIIDNNVDEHTIDSNNTVILNKDKFTIV